MIQRVQYSQHPDYARNAGFNPSKTDGRTPALAQALPEDRVSISRQQENPAFGVKDESELSDEEKQQVAELKKRDTEVKAHEQAHMAAGGGLVQSGASYQYQNGPDGKQYAVGGEVKIDLSPERTPEATIRKMQQVRRAALAPAQPSGTDRSVAAQAAQIEAQARMERTQQTDSSPNLSTLGTRVTGDSHAASDGEIPTGRPGQPLGAYQSPSSAPDGGLIDLMV
jgi:hypothetical protein